MTSRIDPARFSPAARRAYDSLTDPDGAVIRILRDWIAVRLKARCPAEQVARAMADDANFVASTFGLARGDPERESLRAFVADLVRLEAEDARPSLRLVR